jgi:hypothetical protein
MSALPPKADINGRCLDVRFVPKADKRIAANKLIAGDLCAKAIRSELGAVTVPNHSPKSM